MSDVVKIRPKLLSQAAKGVCTGRKCGGYGVGWVAGVGVGVSQRSLNTFTNGFCNRKYILDALLELTSNSVATFLKSATCLFLNPTLNFHE